MYKFFTVSPDILNNETSTDVSVVEGGNATLSCKAVGRPTPRILWKREDGQPIFLKNLLYSKYGDINNSMKYLLHIFIRGRGVFIQI